MSEIEVTDQFMDWFDGLDEEPQERVGISLDKLAVYGPGLDRPFVDTVKGSRHAHMKELRPPGRFFCILFAFDPRRTAILLIGGDKRGRWQIWYDETIPWADELYDEHLVVSAANVRAALIMLV